MFLIWKKKSRSNFLRHKVCSHLGILLTCTENAKTSPLFICTGLAQVYNQIKFSKKFFWLQPSNIALIDMLNNFSNCRNLHTIWNHVLPIWELCDKKGVEVHLYREIFWYQSQVTCFQIPMWTHKIRSRWYIIFRVEINASKGPIELSPKSIAWSYKIYSFKNIAWRYYIS